MMNLTKALVLLGVAASTLAESVVGWMPFPFSHAEHFAEHVDVPIHQLEQLVRGDENLPIWPTAFNSTLIKVGEHHNNEIKWAKLYYDYGLKRGGASRFDFFHEYVEVDHNNEFRPQWPIRCSIIFNGFDVWHVDPEKKQCSHRSSNLPSVNPAFVLLLGAVEAGEYNFRGVKASRWRYTDPDVPSHQTAYFALRNDNSIPLRSMNQVNDPGATDYVDVYVGPQDESTFDIPDYCFTNPQIPSFCD
ncbi:MAG: hypothetical protein MHM6MM_003332 [Cercozoa sp. M6MM]